jgi:hypothetical protein
MKQPTPTTVPPPSLLDLYTECAHTRSLRSLYGAYVDMVTAQALALAHLRQLDHTTPLDGLVTLLNMIEGFAVTHLQRAIEESETE